MQSKMAQDARNSRLEALRLRAEEKVPMKSRHRELSFITHRSDRSSPMHVFVGLVRALAYLGNAG